MQTVGEPTLQEDAAMTVQEVAAFLRINSNTVYKLVSAGTLPSVKIGRSRRFFRSDIVAALTAA